VGGGSGRAWMGVDGGGAPEEASNRVCGGLFRHLPALQRAPPGPPRPAPAFDPPRPRRPPGPRAQAFDAAAALALLGYQPPPPERSAAAGDEADPDLLGVLQQRSERSLGYFTPRDTANAVFVMSRVGRPGAVAGSWLRAWEEVRPRRRRGQGGGGHTGCSLTEGRRQPAALNCCCWCWYRPAVC
jgi:hypothetical protein